MGSSPTGPTALTCANVLRELLAILGRWEFRWEFLGGPEEKCYTVLHSRVTPCNIVVMKGPEGPAPGEEDIMNILRYNTWGEAIECRRYSTRDEAIEWEIIDPIEAGGVVPDARAEFDIDAIADEVLGDYEDGFASRVVDHDTFWAIVEKHEKTAQD